LSSPIDEGLAAIVVAAGSGRRFGADKLFVSLGGQPVLAWSLTTLAATPAVRSIVVVFSAGNAERGNQVIRRLGFERVVTTCFGGARRQDSVMRGVQAAIGSRWVAIHDAARPFLSGDLIERGARAAGDVGAAIAAVPVKDTIKRVESDRLIESTPRRSQLWAAQTPQIFQWEQLVLASQTNGESDVTDEAELLERAGLPVAVFLGSYENIKITTPEDLVLARAIARSRRAAGVAVD
jgi:2-C-methyl-D-erythritol 4-phosphate cytidylyltransferase